MSITVHAFAQEADTLNYFPLDPGNSWTYFYVLEPPFMPPDTVWSGTYTITEEISIQDTLYQVAPHPYSLATTLRYDGEGKVWALVNGQNRLYWDFTLDEGESYSFMRSDSTEYEVVLEHKGGIEIGGGRFDDVIELHFRWQGMDGDRLYAFAASAGIVYAYGGGGEYKELYSAEIGGRTITSIASEKVVDGINVSVYPNPLMTCSHIVVEGSNNPVSIEILDVLGRTVRVYQEGNCQAGCLMTVDRSNLASGVYFLVVSEGRRRSVKKLVIGG